MIDAAFPTVRHSQERCLLHMHSHTFHPDCHAKPGRQKQPSIRKTASLCIYPPDACTYCIHMRKCPTREPKPDANTRECVPMRRMLWDMQLSRMSLLSALFWICLSICAFGMCPSISVASFSNMFRLMHVSICTHHMHSPYPANFRPFQAAGRFCIRWRSSQRQRIFGMEKKILGMGKKKY